MSQEPAGVIRPAREDDRNAVLDLAVASGLFQVAETEELDGLLSAYFRGELDGHEWVVYEEGKLLGSAYFAPETMTDGTWNLYFIAVQPAIQGQGLGSAMVAYVEQSLRSRGERLLLVETSGLVGFARTREFYRKNGYEEEARIREFYDAGEEKIVFRKLL